MYNDGMRRILLVIENLNEMLFIEGLLKKLGFDVESIRNEAAISEKIIAFGPDMVIETGVGQRLDGGRIAARVKKQGNIRLLLLFPHSKLQDKRFLESYLADGAIETPVNPRSLIKAICQFTGIDKEKILKKFDKLSIAQNASPEAATLQVISGKIKEYSEVNPTFKIDPKADKERTKNYDKYLADLPETGQNGLPTDAIRDTVRDIHKNIDDPENEEIDKRRKDFVLALYKK